MFWHPLFPSSSPAPSTSATPGCSYPIRWMRRTSGTPWISRPVSASGFQSFSDPAMQHFQIQFSNLLESWIVSDHFIPKSLISKRRFKLVVLSSNIFPASNVWFFTHAPCLLCALFFPGLSNEYVYILLHEDCHVTASYSLIPRGLWDLLQDVVGKVSVLCRRGGMCFPGRDWHATVSGGEVERLRGRV